MIQEAYVSFETARLLKEKDFREGCEHFYESGVLNRTKEGEFMYNRYDHLISAPTHQMALAWLREAHELYIDIFPADTDKWQIYVVNLNSFLRVSEISYHKTYEEAIETGLKYTLNLL